MKDEFIKVFMSVMPTISDLVNSASWNRAPVLTGNRDRSPVYSGR